MIDNPYVIFKLNLSYCIYLLHLISTILLRVWLPVKEVFVILNWICFTPYNKNFSIKNNSEKKVACYKMVTTWYINFFLSRK